MSESTKRGFDGLHTVATVTTQFMQALLLLMCTLLSALRGRLAAGIVQQCCGSESLVTLQGADQHEQRRMLVTNHVCESMVPAFAHIVGSLAASKSRVVHVPDTRRKQRRKSTCTKKEPPAVAGAPESSDCPTYISGIEIVDELMQLAVVIRDVMAQVGDPFLDVAYRKERQPIQHAAKMPHVFPFSVQCAEVEFLHLT